jgi:hypothetical protein
MLPPGVAAVQDAPKEEMEKALAAATEAATRDHGWSDLIGTLVAEDRRTLGTPIKEAYTDLYNLADEFRYAWKKKYGGNGFDVKAGELGQIRAAAGEVKDPAPLATNWPVSPGNVQGIAGQARAIGNTEEVQERVAGPAPQGERPARLGTGGREDPDQMKAGLQVGVLELGEAQGLPVVRVSLIKEQGGWKIDIPNYRTESLIRDDLMGQLRELLRTRDQWPANASDGTRMVTQRVMMAVYGIAPQSPQRG